MRLFSTIAHGPAGVGLLLVRLVAGVSLVLYAIPALRGDLPMGPTLLHAVSAGLGVFLLLGLWTPIAGALVAVASFWIALLQPADRWYHLMVGALGVALALLGPGAWSVDARLFGWKRLEIPARKRSEPPPE